MFVFVILHKRISSDSCKKDTFSGKSTVDIDKCSVL
nr:MAG TPA: hypothetical protein [Caudoviricetes sp.]